MKDYSIFTIFFESALVVQICIIVLLIQSIVLWSIIYNKYLSLKNVKKAVILFEDILLYSKTINKIQAIAEAEPLNPLARLFISSISVIHDKDSNQTGEYSAEALQEKMRYSMEITYNTIIEKMSSQISILGIISSSAPFIGLLGTVWGIMGSFALMGTQDQISLMVLAPALSEALITTALGLITAIPASIGYNYFIALLSDINQKIERSMYQIDFIVSSYIHSNYNRSQKKG